MSRIIPDSVPSTDDLPKKVDVVVVGGGIAGVATALCLAERGISVALCEKGLIAGEQSGRNWGWARQAGRDPAEIPLAQTSLTLWKDMNRRTGEETGFRQTGIAYLCSDRRREAEYEAWIAEAAAFGIDSRMIRGTDLNTVMPGMDGSFLSAMFTASDGRAEPFKAAPAMARAAIRAGAHILPVCAVRTVERSAGRISGVVTEKGPIACSSVVLASGAWTRLFAGNIGLDFAQLKVLVTAARTAPLSGVPDFPVGAEDFAFRRRLDGGFTIARRNIAVAPIVPDSFRLAMDFAPNLVNSRDELRIRVGHRFIEEWRTPRSWAPDEITPFERVRILDPQPVERLNREGLSNLAKAFPAFRDAKILQNWAGLIDVTPDAVPVISAVDPIPGLYIASGLSGHGFGLGPAIGQLMSEILLGDQTCVDPTPYRLDRFKRSQRLGSRAEAH